MHQSLNAPDTGCASGPNGPQMNFHFGPRMVLAVLVAVIFVVTLSAFVLTEVMPEATMLGALGPVGHLSWPQSGVLS